VYLAPVLINLTQMACDSPLRDTREVDCAHVPRAKVRFPIPINTDHLSLFICNASSWIIIYSANHTKIPSRINAVFCHVLSIPRGHSVRENYLNLWRDLLVSLLLAIYFLSKSMKLTSSHFSKNEILVTVSNALRRVLEFLLKIKNSSGKLIYKKKIKNLGC